LKNSDELFNFASTKYRIAPEPVYKPYEKVSAGWLGKEILRKDKVCLQLVHNINFSTNKVNGKTLEELFNYWFIDGSTVFGEVVND